MSRKIIIAIDGYSSTGKSTFAKLIARKTGYLHLDSGAVYRAVTLFGIRGGWIDADNNIDTASLRKAMRQLRVSLRPDTYINEENVEGLIRQMDVSNAVSPVSALGFVREFVDRLLRRYGKKGGIVMDGRDIGTNVFPDAQLKIFMTADDKVRAQRRYDEMVAGGKEVTFEEVMKNIQDRDYKDTHREISPLRQAPDAIVLDNTDMTLEQEMDWFTDLMRTKFGIELK
ncbi:MAG: (d)CMP kinase [Bacteroidales bacterium]|nr:(d)CMP kinase [Bacteroidales bacterium]